ncbi:hypothetical protein HY484_04780 [Candidatus Woesearchaeota archaeon]|nr:hypothetical protein [Candidatus Woesearchaeota archaeon]
METICVKFEDEFAKDIEKAMKKHRYTTKTEFIREAVRDKLSDFEKEEMIKHLHNFKGVLKNKTTDEDIHRIREQLAREWDQKFK